MSDLKAKMQRNQFRLGSAHTPLRELTALPRLPIWILLVYTSKKREGNGREYPLPCVGMEFPNGQSGPAFIQSIAFQRKMIGMHFEHVQL